MGAPTDSSTPLEAPAAATAPFPYGARLERAVADRGPLCVGLDPHPYLLEAWGLPVDATGLERCARGMVEAVGDQVAVFKPQSAFFEAHGPDGVAVLARTLQAITAAGAVSILDVKRGDIGSTMDAYARAYLGSDAPMRADAITLSPYLGLRALAPALRLAQDSGAGVYVLVRTSNPEGSALQSSASDGRQVAQQIIDEAIAWREETGFADIGAVIGATLSQLDLDLAGYDASILAPGIGAQGGSLTALAGLFGEQARNVLPSVSREVLQAGPDHEALRTKLDELLSVSMGEPDE